MFKNGFTCIFKAGAGLEETGSRQRVAIQSKGL